MLELDEKGYDLVTGFNRKGIHKDTQTRYDADGYDYKGYDEKGFNKYGYNREGDKLESGKKKIKFNREKPTKENDSIFNYRGTNARGFRKDGTNIFRGKYDRRGFDFDGINEETGTKYNKWGHDAYGYNKDGFDEYGFNKEGINEYTGGIYDLDGFDKNGINERGFLRNKKHISGSVYDEKGFNYSGLWHGKKIYSEETGYDYRGFNREGIHEDTHNKFDPKGYDKDGYNEGGYDKEGFDRLGIDSDGINRETQTKDSRLIFAEEFIGFGKSIEAFAIYKQMTLEAVKSKIEEIRISPVISDKIEKALIKNTNKFIGTMETKKKQLLTGEISVKEIKGIDVILRLASPEEKEKIVEMLVKQISSHDIKIFEYRDILGINNSDKNLPKVIIEKIKELNNRAKQSSNKEVRLLSKEIYKEITRVNAYSAPYIPQEGERMGYRKNPEDKEATMVQITDEYRDMAKQYLRATNDFICNKTMNVCLFQIIQGKLTNEMIKRAKDEKELRTLQKEDKELDEVTELAKKVVITRDKITEKDTNDNNDAPNL